MSKIRDIVTVVIVIISLSLASFPVAAQTAQSHAVAIESNSIVSGSAMVGYGGGYLTGVISSNIAVRVVIYNNGVPIHDETSTYHHFPYNHLDKGFMGIFVINEYALVATVSYRLTVGHHDIILS